MYDWDEPAEWQREQPDRPATVNEAIDEYARNAGAMFPDRAWLSTSWDTWVQNRTTRVLRCRTRRRSTNPETASRSRCRPPVGGETGA